MCDTPCDRTKCDCACLENIKSLELLCPEDGIPCECAQDLQIRTPVKTEERPVKTEAVEKTAKTWRTFFARLFPMLSCTSEVAVSVQ